jgi:transcriptional regulator with XRE-family HTH domain
MYGDKIRTIRKIRGFSQEYVAQKIGIEQNSYSRIERNETKRSTEMVEKISEALGVSPIDIMNHEPAIINMASNQGTQQGIGYIEHFYNQQEKLVDKIIDSKDKEISDLKEIISSAEKEKQRLLALIESLSKTN